MGLRARPDSKIIDTDGAHLTTNARTDITDAPVVGRDLASSPLGRRVGIAALIIGLLGALLFLDVRSGQATNVPIDFSALKIVLCSLVSVAAIAAGLVTFARWRVDRDRADWWVGLGLTVLGVVTYGLPVVAAVLPGDSSLSLLAPVGLVTGFFAFWKGLITGLPLRTQAWNAVGLLMTVVIIAMQLLSPTGDDSAAPVSIGRQGWGWLLLVFVALALAVAYGFRGLRIRRPLYTALGLMLVTVVFGHLLGAIGSDARIDGEALLPLIGLLLVLLAIVEEVQVSYTRQGQNLVQTRTLADQAHEEMRRVQASLEERAHDARSALAAIEGALKVLERRAGDLDDTARVSLETAVASEIARLQRMIAPRPEDVSDTPESFLVADVLAAVASVERLHGTKADLTVPAGLTALGQPTALAEAVHNILENARRYAPGSPVHLHASIEGDRAVIRVEDHGPGIPIELREAIFQRGVRGPSSNAVPGSGLGLHIARRRMRAQGGDVWVEDVPKGGTAFVLTLPSASDGAAVGTEPVDQANQLAEAG